MFYKQVACICALVVLYCATALAGEPFPHLELEDIPYTRHGDYLGFGTTSKHLSDINSQLVLVNIFNVYDNQSRKQADKINTLFRRIDSRGLSGRVKVVGIACGNSKFEVDFFQNEHDSPMPIFTDQNGKWCKALADENIPQYYLLRKNDKGRMESELVHKGPIHDLDSFFKRIMAAAGYSF